MTDFIKLIQGKEFKGQHEAKINDMKNICISKRFFVDTVDGPHPNPAYYDLIELLDTAFGIHSAYYILIKYGHNSNIFINVHGYNIPLIEKQAEFLFDLLKIPRHYNTYYMVLFKTKEQYLLAQTLGII